MNKLAGSKLIHYKKWLTLAEVAKRLSLTCNEEVTETDILRYALAGHLKLSVNFVNKVLVAKKLLFPYTLGTDFERSYDERMLSFGNEVHAISGVWDLPMDYCKWPGEWPGLENEYEKLLSGQAVTRKDFWVFVEDTDGVTWLLQKRLGYAELDADLKAYRDELKQLVNKKSIILEKAKELWMRYYEQMEPFRKRIDLLPESEYCCYYPSNQLPQDSVLVVRAEALREFEQLIADDEQERSTTTCNNKSDLSETERNTMLKLILGMAVDAYGYDPDSSRNSATGDKNGISAKLQARGINIDADTVRKYVNEAKNIW